MHAVLLGVQFTNGILNKRRPQAYWLRLCVHSKAVIFINFRMHRCDLCAYVCTCGLWSHQLTPVCVRFYPSHFDFGVCFGVLPYASNTFTRGDLSSLLCRAVRQCSVSSTHACKRVCVHRIIVFGMCQKHLTLAYLPNSIRRHYSSSTRLETSVNTIALCRVWFVHHLVHIYLYIVVYIHSIFFVEFEFLWARPHSLSLSAIFFGFVPRALKRQRCVQTHISRCVVVVECSVNCVVPALVYIYTRYCVWL